MFRLENVTKVYRKRANEVTAFSAQELVVPTGAYVAIIGPSGSGKTTMLSILGGMLSPDEGQVWLNDVSIYGLSIDERTRLRRQEIGFVFQTFNLVPYLTALENVQIPLYLSGLTKSDQLDRATSLLNKVGLGDRLDHKPGELSTGQQQRVALARTLANDPKLILADEPTGNLDPISRGVVLDFFDDLNRQGRTIIMVTHDTDAAKRASTRLSLADGKILPVSISQPPCEEAASDAA